MKTRLWKLALALLALSFSQPAEAIVLGQLDDFENGTLMSWAGAPGAWSTQHRRPNVSNDNLLEMTADGSGQGGRRPV